MKIEFLVFDNATKLQALREVCVQLTQCYQRKENVYVHVNSAAEAEFIDKLLWTFSDESFLPHSLLASDHAPITIGYETPVAAHTLLNLTNTIPDSYQQYQRVLEVVYQDNDIQKAARERFRQYRENGCELVTHKMKVSFA